MVGQDVAMLAGDLIIAYPATAVRSLKSAGRGVNGGQKRVEMRTVNSSKTVVHRNLMRRDGAISPRQLVHRFQSSNHIRQRLRACRTMCGRLGVD